MIKKKGLILPIALIGALSGGVTGSLLLSRENYASAIGEDSPSNLKSDSNKDNRVDSQDLLNLLTEWQESNENEDSEQRPNRASGQEPQWRLFQPTPAYEIALAFFTEGNYSAAGEAFQAVIETSSQEGEKADSSFHRAFCFYLVGNYATFNQLAGVFHADYPDSPFREGLAYHQAFLAYHNGDWQAAKTQLGEFITNYPSSSQVSNAEFYRAMCAYNMKDYEAFLSAAYNIRSLYPDDPNLETLAWHEALIPYEQQNWTQAHDGFKRFAEIYPNSGNAVHARYHAAIALLNSGRYEEFRDRAEEIFADYQVNPYRVTLTYHVAMIPYLQSRWQESIVSLETFIKTYPSTVDARRAYMLIGSAWLNRSKILLKCGNIEAAAVAREKGKEYFQLFRAGAADLVGGALTSEGDVTAKDVEMMVVESFYLEEMYSELAQEAKAWGERHPNDLEVKAAALFWEGIGLLLEEPSNLKEAGRALDGALEIKIERYNWIDELPARAAFYRMVVAEKSDDKTAARAWLAHVQNEIPEGAVRSGALMRFAYLLE